MKVDCALVLAAGFGTRMGEIGKKVPKPLWPINNTTLLGHQIKYLMSLGIEKIYVNTHHKSDLIKSYLARYFPRVEVLHEEIILGSGGAIHNLAKVRNFKGRVLTFNSDLLINFSKTYIESFCSLSDDITLLGLRVEKPDKYRELIIRNNKLVGLDFTEDSIYYTYSGIANIDLSKIEYVDGESSFFESVANFKEREVRVHKPSPYEMSYLDFGTTHLYLRNLKNTESLNTILPEFNTSKRESGTLLLNSEVNEFEFDMEKGEVTLLK